MEQLKLILNKQNPVVFCFLCFKENEKYVNIDDYVEITNENASIATSLRCISEYLFPYYDLVSNEACENCTKLIIEMYTAITKGLVKIKRIQRLTEKLFNQLESNSVSDGSKITLNLQAADLTANHLEKTEKSCGDKAEINRKLQEKLIKTVSLESLETQCTKTTHNQGQNTFEKLKKTSKTGKCIHKCNECDYKTSDKRNFKAHINKSHLKIRPFVCSSCQKGFFSHKNLKEHSLTHEKGRDNAMVCDVCGERFLYRKTLMIHIRTHINHRPYSCDTCDHKFVTVSQRNEHIKRKHGAKQYKCNLCDKKYSLKKDLQRHIKNNHELSKLN